MTLTNGDGLRSTRHRVNYCEEGDGFHLTIDFEDLGDVCVELQSCLQNGFEGRCSPSLSWTDITILPCYYRLYVEGKDGTGRKISLTIEHVSCGRETDETKKTGEILHLLGCTNDGKTLSAEAWYKKLVKSGTRLDGGLSTQLLKLQS